MYYCLIFPVFTLPKTNSKSPWKGPIVKGKVRLPNIHFQVRTVSFRESIYHNIKFVWISNSAKVTWLKSFKPIWIFEQTDSSVYHHREQISVIFGCQISTKRENPFASRMFDTAGRPLPDSSWWILLVSVDGCIILGVPNFIKDVPHTCCMNRLNHQHSPTTNCWLNSTTNIRFCPLWSVGWKSHWHPYNRWPTITTSAIPNINSFSAFRRIWSTPDNWNEKKRPWTAFFWEISQILVNFKELRHCQKNSASTGQAKL